MTNVFTEENTEVAAGVETTLDLVAEQIRLEEATREEGIARYRSRVEKDAKGGREDGTAYGARLVNSLIHRVAMGINAFIEEASSGKAGVRHKAVSFLTQVTPEKAAYLGLKTVLSSISKDRQIQKVMIEIATSIEDEVRFSVLREADKKYYDRVLAEGAKKRNSYRNKKYYLVYAMNKRQVAWENWSEGDKLHLGAKLLDIIMETVGLVEKVNRIESNGYATVYLKATAETMEWIGKRNEVMEVMAHTCEPMVVAPKPWTTPFDGGYLTANISPKTLVKTRNKEYLNQLEDVDMPLVYDALNAMQNTAWVINRRVLRVMNHLWDRAIDTEILPRKNDYEIPEFPADGDINPEAKAAWKVEAAHYHRKNIEVASKRLHFDISLQTARKYSKYEAIYFPYQMDFRGRVYAIPAFNPQGTDYIKGLLRFSEQKPLGSEGWKWLAIHGANCAGVDKVTFEERVEWVLDHEQEILASAEDPLAFKWWMDQDSPWQFLAFCFEWKGFCDHGEDYRCGLPVALDGSCSGLQHYGAMLRCENTGAAVNLIPADRPQDIYQRVADKVMEELKSLAKEGSEDEFEMITLEDGTERQKVKRGTRNLAHQWLYFGVTRKVTKRSVMTLAYGSREFGFKDQLMEDIIRPAKSAGKDFPFDGDGFQAAGFMAKLIWNAVQKVVVKAAEAMEWLKGAARLVASEGLPIRWITPAGFPVLQDYRNTKSRRVETHIAGARLRVSLQEEVDGIDKNGMANAISPNFIHSCDAAHLKTTVCRASDRGIKSFALIHDSFGTLPADTPELFMTIRETFVEMYKEIDVLERFADQLRSQLTEENQVKLKELPKRGTLELDAITQSRFCFA